MTAGRHAIGVGARPGVRADAVRALLERVAAEHGIDLATALFATVAARADEPGVLDAVRSVAPGARLVGWTAAELGEEQVPHPSRRVGAAVGTPSVAEAAALRTVRTVSGAVASVLVAPKTVGDGVTVAVARGVGSASEAPGAMRHSLCCRFAVAVGTRCESGAVPPL